MENEVLNQILAELKGINVRLDKLEASQAEVVGRFDKLEASQNEVIGRLDKLEDTFDKVRASTLRTELVEYPRIQAALDGIALALERDAKFEARLQSLEERVERHDVAIYSLSS
ncbi:MAG: hypothetical protein LBH28_01790 [Oscillospiraceae bacterium]|nr:hypothetical protein [Oscillospiraceae bacterium]